VSDQEVLVNFWICEVVQKFARGALSAQSQITNDAILKAERIMKQIDLRWSASRVPGRD
jgi:hypothetical protein